MLKAFKDDIAENGANASCVYVKSVDEETPDYLLKNNDIVLLIKQQNFRNNAGNQVMISNFEIFSNFDGNHNWESTVCESYRFLEGEVDMWGNKREAIKDVSTEYQRHVDEFFSDQGNFNKNGKIDSLNDLFWR
jgi:hypothetical protein